jgi:hypothetical protein
MDDSTSAVEKTTETAETETKPTETVDFWKAKAREQEKRAKANAEAGKRLTEIEQSQKTEQEKITERLAAAERRAVDAERKVLAASVAAAKGVPASALIGEDEDALCRQADELIAWRDAATAKTNTPTVRRPVRSGTATGDEPNAGKERAAAALRSLRPGR